MKGVTNWVWESARDNNTLPAYLKVGDTVCQLCYNGMIVQPSAAMKEDMKATFDDTLLELKILACGHKYHVECLNEVDQKCSPCLEFLKNGIQMNVDQLLERLKGMKDKDKKNTKTIENVQVQESNRTEKLKNEIDEDDELIVISGIKNTEFD
ncbi:4228_t:CDS:2, partial [Ambispora gerdemannii]